jgi:hypothetical protein
MYSYNGVQKEYSISTFMKMMAGRFMSRACHPLRYLFDIFDSANINADERENAENIHRFKVMAV